MDSTRGVAAIAVCCRNSSCNSSCNAIARNGRRTIASFLLFGVQKVVWRDVPNMFQVWSPRPSIAVSPLADFTPSPNPGAN